MIDTNIIPILFTQPWFAVIACSFLSTVLVIILICGWDKIIGFLNRRR